MLKITAVSYLNTLPFIFGIKNSDLLRDYELTLAPPATCAQHIIDGMADIALMPIGALPASNHIKIVSDYCIGANGIVQSVLLLSQIPLHQIKTVGLDLQSRTSVALTRILAKYYWQTQIDTFPIDIPNLSTSNLPQTMVCIGDKAFEWQQYFTYKYDLAAEWKQFTGLPFVFACWVANKSVTNEQITQLNNALKYGIEHKKEAIKLHLQNNRVEFDLTDYLNNAISFDLNAEKKKAMDLFLTYLKELEIA